LKEEYQIAHKRNQKRREQDPSGLGQALDRARKISIPFLWKIDWKNVSKLNVSK